MPRSFHDRPRQRRTRVRCRRLQEITTRPTKARPARRSTGWRWGWDSNPRRAYTLGSFQVSGPAHSRNAHARKRLFSPNGPRAPEPMIFRENAPSATRSCSSRRASSSSHSNSSAIRRSPCGASGPWTIMSLARNTRAARWYRFLGLCSWTQSARSYAAWRGINLPGSHRNRIYGQPGLCNVVRF